MHPIDRGRVVLRRAVVPLDDVEALPQDTHVGRQRGRREELEEAMRRVEVGVEPVLRPGEVDGGALSRQCTPTRSITL